MKKLISFVESVLGFMNKVAPDKLAHYGYGVLLFVLLRFTFLTILVSNAALYAFIAVALIGLAKEYLYDANVEGHEVDVWDAVYTILGGLTGFLAGWSW